MDDYEVTALFKVVVYAKDREDAIKLSARTIYWDDYEFIREETVKCLSDNPHEQV